MIAVDLNSSDIELSKLSGGSTVVKIKVGRHAFLAVMEKRQHEVDISLYSVPPRGVEPEDWMFEPNSHIATVHGVAGGAPVGKDFFEDFQMIADAQSTIDVWQRFVRFD